MTFSNVVTKRYADLMLHHFVVHMIDTGECGGVQEGEANELMSQAKTALLAGVMLAVVRAHWVLGQIRALASLREASPIYIGQLLLNVLFLLPLPTAFHALPIRDDPDSFKRFSDLGYRSGLRARSGLYCARFVWVVCKVGSGLVTSQLVPRFYGGSEALGLAEH